jgi:hypothetical protein
LALQQKTLIDKIEILPETGILQIRQRTDIYDDINPSVIISSAYHRAVLEPGQDVTGQDDLVIAVANLVLNSQQGDRP